VLDEAVPAGGEQPPVTKAAKKQQKKLMLSIDEALKGVQQDEESNGESESEDEDVDEGDLTPVAVPLREALEAIDDAAPADAVIADPAARKRHQLFHGLTFFLSREVPRGYLELIVLSYGGRVGWEGRDSPVRMEDADVTHHVVDRPALLPGYAGLPAAREYVQPQWILDCANFDFRLPVERYGVGAALPPHLSPWVDDGEEGYVPKYKEEVERMRNGEVLDASEDEAPRASEKEVPAESSEEEETFSASGDPQKNNTPDGEESSSSEEEEEDDDDVAGRKASTKKHKEDEEAAQLAKSLMSKKAARLYGRMQHGLAKKQAQVDNLHKKRREIEDTREKSQDGKTVLKLKVERLKKERREKEGRYAETGGSMKKKRRKN